MLATGGADRGTAPGRAAPEGPDERRIRTLFRRAGPGDAAPVDPVPTNPGPTGARIGGAGQPPGRRTDPRLPGHPSRSRRDRCSHLRPGLRIHPALRASPGLALREPAQDGGIHRGPQVVAGAADAGGRGHRRPGHQVSPRPGRSRAGPGPLRLARPSLQPAGRAHRGLGHAGLRAGARTGGSAPRPRRRVGDPRGPAALASFQPHDAVHPRRLGRGWRRSGRSSGPRSPRPSSSWKPSASAESS